MNNLIKMSSEGVNFFKTMIFSGANSTTEPYRHQRNINTKASKRGGKPIADEIRQKKESTIYDVL